MDAPTSSNTPLVLIAALALLWTLGTILAAFLSGNIVHHLVVLPGMGLAVLMLIGLALIAILLRKWLVGGLREIDGFPKSTMALMMLRLGLLGALVLLAIGWLSCAALDLKLSQAFLTALVFTVLVSTGLSLLSIAVVNFQLVWRFRRSPRAIPPA